MNPQAVEALRRKLREIDEDRRIIIEAIRILRPAKGKKRGCTINSKTRKTGETAKN